MPRGSSVGLEPAQVTPRGGQRARQTPPHLWRLGFLVVLLGFLAVLLTPTLRGYLDQRSQIGTVEQQIVAEQAEIERLQLEIARYDDEQFVEQQARERLRFVKPGEVAFTVLDDTGEGLVEPLPGMAQVGSEARETLPWYGEVWQSVLVANDGVPAVEDPAPAGEPAPTEDPDTGEP